MRGALVAFVLAVLSCKPPEPPREPSSSEAGAEQAGSSQAVQRKDEATKKAAAQAVMAKVRDRDPQEEKRKLAQSRQRSAQARKQMLAGDVRAAITSARDALKVHEQNADAMLVLAEVFYRQKKYELVVSVTSTALAIDDRIRTPTETSQAYNLQGFALAQMGRNQQATRAFKKAAETDEKNAAAWNNLGTRYLRAGDLGTAASCFSYALELKPGFAKAHLNYGAALRAQGKLAEAEREYRQALKLKPRYAEAHFNLGLLYLDADPFPNLSTRARLRKAIDELEQYKSLTTGSSTEPIPTGVGTTAAELAPVSRARADDYIRVAHKGLEREDRRDQRQRERGQPEPQQAPQKPDFSEPKRTVGAGTTTATDTEVSPKT